MRVGESERERGGAGSTKKTLRVVLAGAPVKSLGSSEMLFFFVFFLEAPPLPSDIQMRRKLEESSSQTTRRIVRD